MDIKKEFMGILACPKCKGKLNQHNMFVTCSDCKLAYPILDGVPDMLISDTWELSKARENNFKHSLKL